METTIQLQKKAHVLAKNADEVGTLERVVVNPETKEITHIVIRTGSIFNKEDKVVPIDLVIETVGDQIVLSSKAGDPESMPPFEETQYLEKIEANVEEASASEINPVVILGYPSAETAILVDPTRELERQTVQNIPEGTVAMKEGAEVIASEGEHVGNVERVLADPSVDQITHLLVSKGVLSKEIKRVPINWVTAIGEDTVHLRVKKDSVENLEDSPGTG